MSSSTTGSRQEGDSSATDAAAVASASATAAAALETAEALAAGGDLTGAMERYRHVIEALLRVARRLPSGSARREALRSQAARALEAAEALKRRIDAAETQRQGGGEPALPSPPPATLLSDPSEYVPSQRLSDVFGVTHATDAVKECVILPAKFPQLFRRSSSVRRWRGVLLFGPAGCGKAVLARAAAGEADLPLLRVDLEQLVGAAGRSYEDSGGGVGIRAAERAICDPFRVVADLGQRHQRRDKTDDAEGGRDEKDLAGVLLLENLEALSSPPERQCAPCIAAAQIRRAAAAKGAASEAAAAAAVDEQAVYRCDDCLRHEHETFRIRAMRSALLFAFQEMTSALCVVATSTQPWRVCPAVRKRFEKRCYLPPLPQQARFDMLRTLLRRNESHTTRNSVADDREFVWETAERLAGCTGADIECIAKDASFGPLRAIPRATHFKPSAADVDGGGGGWTPCPPDDDGAVAMPWEQIPPNELTLRAVSRADVLRACRIHRPPSAPPCTEADAADQKRYEEFALDFTDQDI